jgi:hypothetical protein
MVALFLVLRLAATVTACGASQETETGEDSTPLTEETVKTESGDIIEQAPDTLKSGQDIPEGIRETEQTEQTEDKAN